MAIARSAASRVVVTGAAGFIGSHLADALLDAEHPVMGLDIRHPTYDPAVAVNLATAYDHPGFTLINTDLTCDPLVEVLSGADAVFHLAAVPGVRASWGQGFDQYLAVNVAGTHRLIEACEAAGVRRLVYASSSSVYGITDGPSRETDPTRPISPYGVSKLAGEQLCLAHAARSDTRLSVVALRFFSVYGPRHRPDMLIGRLLAACLTGTRLSLFGDGTQRREFTEVADVIAATVAAADPRVPSGSIVNIGGGSSVSIIDLLRTTAYLLGCPVPVTTSERQPGDVPATAADLTLAQRLLDYRPTTDLTSGLARQVAWLRKLPRPVFNHYLPAPTPAAGAAR
jgi:nucleoside-diphosphate-sugar epimerase